MKRGYLQSIESHIDDPVFFEELTLLSAQECIAVIMKETKTSETELAKKMVVNKSYIESLLQDGDDLSITMFAKVCFYLGYHITFDAFNARPIIKKSTGPKKGKNEKKKKVQKT